ncbi:MAG TPA: phage tail tape measure protein [Longimicrobiales bacterium]|nr:phage tail tape measure protein [Longimicrobiales bacterium]
MATVGRLNVFLNANITGFTRAMSRVERRLNRVSRRMDRMGSTLTRNLTLPILAGGAAVVKATADWETSLVNIAKTVDATDGEIQALGRSLRGLSEQIPVSANDLAAIASEAGQLGIATGNILGFTRTVASLQVATNLGDQAASSLARLANITGTSQQEFDRMGAAIVDLGNNSATTEAEIVDMGLRIAGAGRQIGQSAAQTLGWAAALSSLGIRAEAGGTAISRVFADIAVAVSQGGERLERLADIAGVSVEEFRQRFQEDGGEAVLSFIEGLGRLQDEGANLFGVLEDVGFGNVRVRDTLLRAAGATDLLRNSLEIGTRAWEENTALTDEASQFFDRLAGRIQILWNRIKNIAAALGDALRPAIERIMSLAGQFLGIVQGLVARFAALSPYIREQVGLWTALAATIGPIVTGFALVVAFFGKAVAVMAGMVSGFGVIVAGIIAVKHNWLGMGDAALSAWNAILDVGPRVLVTVGNAAKPFINFLVGGFVSLGAVVVEFVEIALEGWTLLFDEIKRMMTANSEAVSNWLSGMAQGIRALAFELGVLNGVAADAAGDAGSGLEEISMRLIEAATSGFGTDYVGAFVDFTREGIGRAGALIGQWLDTLRNMAGGGGFAGEIEGVDVALEGVQSKLDEIGTAGTRNISRLGQAVEGVASSFADTLADAISGAAVSFKDFAKAVLADLARMAARFAVFKALTSLFDLSGMGLTSFLGFSLPGKAAGGPVVAGRPYIVGERGPELMVPSQSGTIVPNDALRDSGSGDTASAILSALGPPPPVMSPEQAATTTYYRRLIAAMATDATDRGVSFA